MTEPRTTREFGDNSGPSPTSGSGQPMAQLHRRVALARLVLLWERLWPASWPLLAIIGTFLALALSGLLQALPGWLHLLALIAFASAFVAAIIRGFGHFVLPTSKAAQRRLEADAGLSHHPLTTIQDRPATQFGDAAENALWQAHIARAVRALTRARVGWPRPGLARHDPKSFRIAVLLAVIVGVVMAGGDAGNRLARAISPDLSGLGGTIPASVEMWITPPEYTGLAPIFLDPQALPKESISVPTGSTILAQLHDGRGQPILTLGETEHVLTSASERSWRIEIPVEATQASEVSLVLSQASAALVTLRLALVPDHPPTIIFATPPAASNRAALRIEHSVDDDYGVERATALIERPADQATSADAALAIELILPQAIAGDEAVASFHDLTAHPWAGLPVVIQLTAADAIGQQGISNALTITLPEREFTHPIARQLIALRKQLVRVPDDTQTIVSALAAIGSQPGRYGEDFTVHLALRVAASRLVNDKTPAGLASVQQLLWDTALHIEDGGLSLAERELRELQRRLQEALANNAADEEIKRLLDQLRDALDRFFQAARENLQRQLERGELPFAQPDPNALALSQQDLERLIDRAQDLAEMGARDAAREMLDQLQQMLESLSNQPMFARQPPGQQEAEQLLNELQNITRGQQQLLDRTFNESQQGERPQDGGRASTAEQESLRRQLGEAMRRLGEMTGDIPGELGNAEQAMRQSSQALSGGEPGQALGPQGQALDQLREGARAAAQQLAEQFGGEGQGNQPGQFGEFGDGQDPLGRRTEGNSGLDTGRVAIPEESDLQRAREILDELRRRSGERTRPTTERDYIDRLLRRF